jgi:hypothetical protein
MITHRIRTLPITWIGLGLLLLLLLAACKSEAQLEAEREAEETSATPTATATTNNTATPMPTATTAATLNEPTVLYVSNTGGSGVSLRSACRTDARIAGAWPEGKRVEVVEVGSGDCEGWTLTAADSTETWVSNGYLGDAAPTTVATRSGGSVAPTSSGTTVPAASSSSTVPGEFVVTNYWFTFDQYGFPSLNFTAQNISNETILEFAVDICLFDPDGRPVEQHGSGPTCFRSTHQDLSLAPGDTFTPYKITTFAWAEARAASFDPFFSRTPTAFWRP